MKLETLRASLWLVTIAIFIRECVASCYFPDYLQGEYVTQAGMTLQTLSPVQYTHVSITPEAISTWGYCQRKIGNDLYLIENLENNSYCLRCFHISIKSQNILIVRTGGHPDRCYVSGPSAEASCPKAEYLDASRQMILYKNSQEIKKEPCPINGKYFFRYKQYKSDHTVECSGRSSHIDNCPSGSELNIHFRDCPFENHEIVFECLGTWSGPNNQKYLAVFDTRQGEDPRPQYRCGLFLEDSGSGSVYVSFSSDSTCVTDLKSSQSGFETLVLNPQSNLPPLITERTCRFPNWLQGRWELVNVDGSFFTFTDTTLFKTYKFQCLNFDDSERRHEFPVSVDEERKILVHGRTHCGEEMYSCIWLKRRGPNVFEFQLGTQTSLHYNSSSCSPGNFQRNVWVTQGRKDYLEESPCPVLGEYFGTLPDSENMCAKLWSDCFAPDTMYYTVSDCSQQIYEDREYKCLGQWQDNGLTYTFTQRKHVGTYECFVGSPISENEFMIREAGRHCERNTNALLMGMILTKKSSCVENRTSSTASSYSPTTQSMPVTVTTTKYTPKRLSPTTKPWRPIMNVTRPQSPYRSKNSNANGCMNNVPSQFLIIFICTFYFR